MGRGSLGEVCFRAICIAGVGFLLWRGSAACPADAEQRIRECTQILSNLTESQHKYTEEEYCLTLEKIPHCLRSILTQCRAHHEDEVYESLNGSMQDWKLKFKHLCSWIHDSSPTRLPSISTLLFTLLVLLFF